MDESEYLRLLSASSVNDTTKFAHVDDQHVHLRGRPPKHYHPLLQKEKDVHSILHRILPKTLPLHFLQRVQDWPIFMGFLQYCAKVMNAKYVNFVLCSHDFSTKV